MCVVCKIINQCTTINIYCMDWLWHENVKTKTKCVNHDLFTLHAPASSSQKKNDRSSLCIWIWVRAQNCESNAKILKNEWLLDSSSLFAMCTLLTVYFFLDGNGKFLLKIRPFFVLGTFRKKNVPTRCLNNTDFLHFSLQLFCFYFQTISRFEISWDLLFLI